MNFKKHMKRFFTLSRSADGFTLVELIVVIAILAILGGVAVPAYSGYITKTNITADQKLVSEVANALTMQFYADATFAGTASVILAPDGNGTTSVSGDAAFAMAALDAMYGTKWTNLQLKHDGWTGTGLLSETVTVFNGWGGNDRTKPLTGLLNGDVQPSFKNDIDDLYDLVENTSNQVGANSGMTGMALLQGAAANTANNNVTADYFASKWASSTWSSDILMGEGKGSSYNEDDIDNAKENAGSDAAAAEMFNNALANAAAIKARNTSLATFMRNQKTEWAQYYDLIANKTMGTSSIPEDITAVRKADMIAYAERKGYTTAEAEVFQKAVIEGIKLYIGDKSSSSQAYQDGLAYYGMMDTVGSVNQNGNADTYFEDMRGAVDMYQSMLKDEIDFNGLNAAYANAPEGSVVVTIAAKNGQMQLMVSPAEAALSGK